MFVVFDGDMQNLLGKQCSELVSSAKVLRENQLLELRNVFRFNSYFIV